MSNKNKNDGKQLAFSFLFDSQEEKASKIESKVTVIEFKPRFEQKRAQRKKEIVGEILKSAKRIRW